MEKIVYNLREEFLEYAFAAAREAGIEVPSREVFARYSNSERSPTSAVWCGIKASVAQGRSWADPAWLDPVLGFERFVVDMGPRPDGHGLERIDKDQPWGFRNAQWAPKAYAPATPCVPVGTGAANATEGDIWPAALAILQDQLERKAKRSPQPGYVLEARKGYAEQLAGKLKVAPECLKRLDSNYLYYTWKAMNQRCFNKGVKGFHNYGGRGIGAHLRWSKHCPFGFENFAAYILSTLGHRPSAGHSLDRIDNSGHYGPGNLRWATAKEQAANKSR
jgi:hypothetical protein